MALRDATIVELKTAKLVVEGQLQALAQQHKESQLLLAGLQEEHSALQGAQEVLTQEMAKAQAELAQVRRWVRSAHLCAQ